MKHDRFTQFTEEELYSMRVAFYTFIEKHERERERVQPFIDETNLELVKRG